MGLCRDLCVLIRELVAFLTGPDAYAERKRQEEQRFWAERRGKLEARYGDLDTLFSRRTEPVYFSTFVAALDCIADSLEEDAPGKLAALIPDSGRRLEPDWLHQPGHDIAFITSSVSSSPSISSSTSEPTCMTLSSPRGTMH